MAGSRFTFRLIPITLIACGFFTLFKLDEIATGQKYLAKGLIPPAYAQGDEAAKEEPKEETKDAPKEEAKAEEHGDKPAQEGSHGDKKEEKKEGEAPAPSLTPRAGISIHQRLHQEAVSMRFENIGNGNAHHPRHHGNHQPATKLNQMLNQRCAGGIHYSGSLGTLGARLASVISLRS